MRDYFYYMACPLCQHDVDPSQPDYYRVLPLDSEKMTVFNEKPVCDEYDYIKVGDLTIDPGLCYPDLEYMQKAWCLHTRCLAFVDHLPLAKLYILLDLVEPTFLRRRNEPKSRCGDFCSQPIQEQDPIPAPTVTSSRQMTKSLWEALRHFFHCTISRKEQLDSPSSPLLPAPPSPLSPALLSPLPLSLIASLPPEIWNMVLRYDIGRLLFVAGTASQLARLGIESKIPRTRFTVNVLDLPSSMIQIHLISIGGRSYISNLSGSVVNCGTQDNNTKCYNIRGKDYLAIKSDGIGIVDIAFEQQERRPQWILDNSTEPFTAELSQIRGANLQSLRIVRDVCIV